MGHSPTVRSSPLFPSPSSQNLTIAGYECSIPDQNGDGRAQCAVGNGFSEPFNVTVYADDGSVYKVGMNDTSTPSPDYAGKGFFNDTFYPLATGGNGTVVGPADLGSFCAIDQAPNVKEGDGSGTSETGTAVPSGTRSDSVPASSGASTSTASDIPTVPIPTGTGTGYVSLTGGYMPSGSAYYGPSTPTPGTFTGDASFMWVSSMKLAFVGGIVMMVAF